MEQTFGRGYQTLYHSILLYFILSIVIVTNIEHFLLRFSPKYYASILLCFWLPIIPKYFADKINLSLTENSPILDYFSFVLGNILVLLLQQGIESILVALLECHYTGISLITFFCSLKSTNNNDKTVC